MIRAVLGVNVLVSPLLSPRGAPARILDLWRGEAFVVVTGEAMLTTLEQLLSRRAFARKYRLTARHRTALLRGLRHFALVTPGACEISGVAPDAEDDAVVACAVEGEADYVLTGDRGLLALEAYEGIPILLPASFVKALAEQGRADRT
jgi:putative PIN family toxin of toxin-antitoxin system